MAGGLVNGAPDDSAVGTPVERAILFSWVAAVDRESGFSNALNRNDAPRRLSLTHEQSQEMTKHTESAKDMPAWLSIFRISTGRAAGHP